MSSIAGTPHELGRRERIASATMDSLLIGWRTLKRIPRIPELAIFAILQSIMFVLLVAFVFGGAISIPGGGEYKSFLMPGIFAQTIVFAAGTTAIGMTDDVAKGIVDRFRSLPIAHLAVLTGRTVGHRDLQRWDPARADGDRVRDRVARRHRDRIAHRG